MDILLTTRVNIERQLGDKVHPRLFSQTKMALIENVALPIDTVSESLYQKISTRRLSPIKAPYKWTIGH